MWKKLWEIGIRGKMWEMIKRMTKCARSAVMLDGETSKYVDILRGIAQRCTLSPNESRHILMASRSSKAQSCGEGKYGVEIDVCG